MPPPPPYNASIAGHRDTHPHLREFLASANKAASQVIRGDVEASCADPKRWLNSAGHDLLSDLPGFGDHNASMLWGTYRPGVYFGEKQRNHAPCIKSRDLVGAATTMHCNALDVESILSIVSHRLS